MLLISFSRMLEELQYFAGSEIQKLFLDVHTARAHVANNPVNFSRNYGAMQLGAENTDYFV